ncbi:hypothetical protein K0M31_016049 [Melipona bicolor]|uniref:Uncharacterized protein n=1 Tax=Melipona bicolor TaxID=60889 RepID=A0AA40G6G5_9HYME|nr:hypothetical protein K0M31_016049 [Melipona bicolor]
MVGQGKRRMGYPGRSSLSSMGNDVATNYSGSSTCVLTGERARYSNITDISSKNERKGDKATDTVGRRSGKARESQAVKGKRVEHGSSNGRSVSQFLTDLRPVLSHKGTDDHALRKHSRMLSFNDFVLDFNRVQWQRLSGYGYEESTHDQSPETISFRYSIVRFDLFFLPDRVQIQIPSLQRESIRYAPLFQEN